MALQHTTITPIPDNEPDAVPSLWNTRYDEINDNFQGIDSRLAPKEAEIIAARGGKASLDARLGEIETNVEGLDPDMQNMLMSFATMAVDAAGLANREVERIRGVYVQEGEVTIPNKGVISGCAVSKSATATRNLNLSLGRCFMHGRVYAVDSMDNTAAVPANNSAVSATCYVYIYTDENGDLQCNCTSLGESVPEGGAELMSLSVPPGNNETTDPYLANVTMTATRRLEPNYPLMFENPAFLYIPLANILPDADYAVHTEIVSVEGGEQQAGELLVKDRLKNGFKLYLSGAGDAVNVRYSVIRLKP